MFRFPAGSTSQHLNLKFILLNLFVLLTALLPVEAAHNVTVDDADRRITYSPASAWKSYNNHTDHISKTGHYTNTKSAYAEFSFTGATNIYFVGYGLTTANNTLMSVVFDGNTYTVDQKRASSSRAKAYLWSSGVISPSTTHTIKCLKTTNTGANDMNIDAFILTIPDVVNTTTTTSTVESSTSTEEPSSTTSESSTSTTHTSTTTSVLPVWNPSDGEIAEISTTTESPSSSPTAPPTPAISKTNIAVIIGSSLGGLAFIVIIIAGLIFRGRLKEHRTRNDYRKWYQARYLKEKENQGAGGGGEDIAGTQYGEAYPMTQPHAPVVIPRPSTATSGHGTLSSINVDAQFQAPFRPHSPSGSSYQDLLRPLPSQSPQLQIQSLQQNEQQQAQQLQQLLTPPSQSSHVSLSSHSPSQSISRSLHSHLENSPTPMGSRAIISDRTSDTGDIGEIGQDPHELIAPQPPPYSPREGTQSALPQPLPMMSNSTIPVSSLPPSSVPDSNLHNSTIQTMFLPLQPFTPSPLQQTHP